jgi:hypothetical protein
MLTPIPGYEGRFSANEDGQIFNHNKNDFMLPSDSNGYDQVTLWNGLKGRSFGVHRLIALTFLKNVEGLKVVNHKDGNRKNNHVDNLEWQTQSDNIKHSYLVLNRTRPYALKNYATLE